MQSYFVNSKDSCVSLCDISQKNTVHRPLIQAHLIIPYFESFVLWLFVYLMFVKEEL
mgnify:CR=1 FL=1|jgi:hypothetical protein